jgi:integrase/recombinase XerD
VVQFKREPLTPEQSDRLSDACETDVERAVVWTLLDTGLRVSELCGLTRDRVHGKEHELRIRGKGGPSGKLSKLRVVPMSTRCAAQLEPLLTVHHSLEAMQLSERTVQRMIKTVAGRARIRRPCTPHVLRHTFAVTCIRKGLSLSTIQKLLGHDSLQTTQIYLNMSPRDVVAEYRRLW